ncbi:MAG: hypothetical protein C6W55_06905 [Thermobacillus sp.]|uniref:Uncharacterized protein n=1 Tax=Thermobacillus composti (strain DSM 18247 / JCM 13945 / KWC4) TaxID=717605 RepID=L0EE37_THECK|nr:MULTISPECIES: DUF5590 domain-containing protein [Thermobacillus]AGA57941.1 hypothetical protein Theco_1810 [Thermobacillus composti KWC4]REK56874.1 MAG: hypothetical protein C6W55_06905 [Thermobacillus sp.]
MRRRQSDIRFMTPKRWAVIILLGIGLVLMLLNLYFQWARSDYVREERDAIRRVKAEAGLTKVESAVKFVWDDIVWIIRGEREDGADLYVWAFADRIESVHGEEAYDVERLRQDVLRAFPDASIIRIRPGYAEGRRIWEVYYSREESDVKRHYYGFYAFEDGRPIETYRLPARSSG